jgi:hypothetical protein
MAVVSLEVLVKLSSCMVPTVARDLVNTLRRASDHVHGLLDSQSMDGAHHAVAHELTEQASEMIWVDADFCGDLSRSYIAVSKASSNDH